MKCLKFFYDKLVSAASGVPDLDLCEEWCLSSINLEETVADYNVLFTVVALKHK